MDIYNLVSFAGMFVLLGFAWLLSNDRKNINFRVIGWGIVLQLLLVHPRSAVIKSYALCGFAHLASMAIFVGRVCALAPEKAHNIGGPAVRALIAATLACLLTARVAGTFFTEGSILLGGL